MTLKLRDSHPAVMGDQRAFVEMGEETKLLPSYVIGKSTRETTTAFFAQFTIASHLCAFSIDLPIMFRLW